MWSQDPGSEVFLKTFNQDLEGEVTHIWRPVGDSKKKFGLDMCVALRSSVLRLVFLF